MRALFVYIFLFVALLCNAQQVFVQVRKNMDHADFRRCVIVLDSCLRKNYQEDSALFYKTLVHLKTNEVKAARKTAAALFKAYPDYKDRHYLTGLILVSEENYGKSIHEFELALESNPKNVKILYNRSIAFGLLEEYLSAIEDLGACIAINPGYAAAYYSRAYWYEFTGNYREAVKDYEMSLGLDPANYEAYLGLANSYKNLDDMAKACEAIARAIKEGSQAAGEFKDQFCK